jgi:hypothetical protein
MCRCEKRCLCVAVREEVPVCCCKRGAYVLLGEEVRVCCCEKRCVCVVVRRGAWEHWMYLVPEQGLRFKPLRNFLF